MRRYADEDKSLEDILGMILSLFGAESKADRILADQMKSWVSDCYAHFKMPPKIITTKGGVIKYAFHCLKSVHLYILLVCMSSLCR